MGPGLGPTHNIRIDTSGRSHDPTCPGPGRLCLRHALGRLVLPGDEGDCAEEVNVGNASS